MLSKLSPHVEPEKVYVEYEVNSTLRVFLTAQGKSAVITFAKLYKE